MENCQIGRYFWVQGNSVYSPGISCYYLYCCLSYNFKLLLYIFIFFSSQGRCIDGINKYSCLCDPGYVGINCDTDYDDCSSSPCVHGQ